MPRIHNFTVMPALPEQLKDLDFIARNLFWSWNPELIELFKRIDSDLWHASGHNPIKLLGSIPQQNLEQVAQNKGFLSELGRSADKLRQYLQTPGWYQRLAGADCDSSVIAYFSAEFGLHESLPIYSGGLGILAGDHLKSASDLGIPLVAVGLLYQKGYFCQYLNVDGWQQEVYVDNDFYSMPVELIRDAEGNPLTIAVQYPGRKIFAQVWRMAVGRVSLHLLDTNIEQNAPADRSLTANLYGGDNEMRICQEIMLGIGGLRALEALDIHPTVCHMNEGHAAFLALERIRTLTETQNMNFDEAVEATKAGNIFTVHTPVKAGNDEFPPQMMIKYFDHFYPRLKIDRKQFLGLGRINAVNDEEAFKMPVLAMRLSAFRNGVSETHGHVSRKMWQSIWPEVPVAEVPIGSVTNGIHLQNWVSEEIDALFQRYVSPDWTNEFEDTTIWNSVNQIPDEEFWRAHQRAKDQLVAFARNRLKSQMRRRGTYHTELNWAEEVLDPEALTIGFARRFASYKRGNLLLRETQRLKKLLTDSNRPLQFIFAGKAHPRDSEGKEIIRQLIAFANQYDVRRRIVFLEDYNMDVGRMLVRGVDVWLNNPRPPMEASGTSGMKAAVNGILNCSTYDGWWCEGYKHNTGWVIGSGETYDDPEYQDNLECHALFNILENEIIPLFYTRSKDNIPRAWIYRMKQAIRYIAPRFNTHRMVSEYTTKFYVPAAEKCRRLKDKAMEKARQLSQWKAYMKNLWPQLSIKDVEIECGHSNGDNNGRAKLAVGSEINVKALVRLGKAQPTDVTVQLYHGPLDAWGNICQGDTLQMQYATSADKDGEHWFCGKMPCKAAGRQGLSVRVLPNHQDLADPYELGLILWEGAEKSRVQN